MLAGDFIVQALRRGDLLADFDLDAVAAVESELDQGGTDPGNIAEFLAHDLPFEVEPATGLIFPAEVDRG
jgi:hypothetical protein